MGVNLTLNDFKRVLGNVNDGDVVYKKDSNGTAVGIEKANHGNLLTRKVHGYRTATSTENENLEIREKLLAAIKLSPEGRVLTEQNIGNLRAMLGLDDENARGRILSRDTLKAVLDKVEALSRGQDVETKTPSVSLKGILQMADNRILRQQVDCLQQRGFSSLNSLKVIQNVRKCTQNISTIMDEKYLKLIFEKGYMGHTKQEMLRFVRNSAASIQSQIFDKLFWRLQDATAAEQPGKKVVIKYTYKDVLLEVIDDMISGYAKGKEPVAKALVLLRPSSAPSLGDDGQLQAAGRDFLAGIDRKLNLLVGRSTSSRFDSVQLARFVSQLRARLYQTYEKAFTDAGDAARGKEAAEQAVKTMLGGLADYPDALVDSLGRNEKVRNMIGRLALSQIGTCAAVDGRLTDGDFVKVLTSVVSDLNRVQDMSQVVRRYLDEFGVNEKKRDALGKWLTEVLNRTEGPFGDALVDIRRQMIEAAANDGNPAVVALGVIGNSAFTNMVNDAVKDLVDPEAVQTQRVELFKAAAAILQRDSSDSRTTVADRFLRDIRRAYLPGHPFLQKLADPVFCGKVAIASSIGLFDGYGKEDLDGIFDISTQNWNITPENFDRVVDLLNRAVASLSSNDIKLAMDYIRTQLANADSVAQVVRKGAWPFRDALWDGILDFSKKDSRAADYLVAGLRSEYMRGAETGYLDLRDDLKESSIPEGAYQLLYVELKEAAEKLASTYKLSAKKTKDFLEQQGLELSDAPVLKAGSGILCDCDDGVLVYALKNLGFGTNDPVKLHSLLLRIGLKPEDLDSPEDWMKAHRLELVIAANNGHAEGAIEWAERIIGKPFEQMRIVDIVEHLLSKSVVQVNIDDPQSKLKGDARTVADFIGGKLAFAEAGLSPDDLAVFMRQLRKLELGEEKVEVVLFGQVVAFRRCPNGELTAKLGTGEKAMSVFVAHTLAELLVQVENLIADKARDFTSDQIRIILPQVPKGSDPLARPRELYTRVLSSLLGLPGVNFSHLTVAELRRNVERALDNRNVPGLVNEFSAVSKSFLSAEAVELQAKFLAADGVSRGIVKLPPSPSLPPFDPSKGVPLTTRATHDLLAELVMNKDTWAFDEGNRSQNRGVRLFKLLKAYGNEICYVSKNLYLLDTLPGFKLENEIGDVVRSRITGIIEDLAGLAEVGDDEAVKARCAELEAKLDKMVDAAMSAMQEKATSLFKAKDVVRPEGWKRSLAESTGADGLSSATMQGRFTQSVLQNYFVRCDSIEKRAMLANIFRNADNTSSEGKLVGEMLKGAGPLLQKTLQGLPLETFGKETQTALIDMKSNLLPISDIAIQAQLLELVRSSKGQILSVEVKKSIGQATVGQALLCHVRTKDRPVTGEDVVIKVLRPNVQTAVRREYELFLDLAKQLDDAGNPPSSVQQDALKARYQGVLQEFDFSFEASNIDLCHGVYDKPTVHLDDDRTEFRAMVHSMDRFHAVPGMTGAVMLQKVEGIPVDRLFENTRKEVGEILKDIQKVTQAGSDGPVVTVYQADSSHRAITAKIELWNKRQMLVKQRESLAMLVDAWLENALFGEGVFHADLHPGNVMIDGFDVSVIDFGNVGRLQKREQAQLVYMFADAMTGDAGDFLERIRELLTDSGKQTVNGCEKALLTELKEILSKGTSKDVLPRLLAALSSLKDKGIPIPDSIQNFAESMTRLQGVIDGMASVIEEIEYVSNEITVAAPDHDSWTPPARQFAVLDDFRVFIGNLVGTANEKFAPDTLSTRIADFRDKHQFGDIPSSYKLEDNPGAVEVLHKKMASVFNQKDGGVGFLKDLLKMLTDFPSVSINQPHITSDVKIANVSFVKPYALSSLVTKYVDQCTQEDVSAEEKTTQQKRIACEIIVNLNWILRMLNPSDEDGCAVIAAPADVDRFFGEVGNSLVDRSTSIAVKLGVALGIAEEKVHGALKSEGVWGKLFNAASDLVNFARLKSLNDRLSILGEAATKLDNRVKIATKESLSSLGVHLSHAQMRKIEACAREFRLPADWKPGTDLAANWQSVTEIIETNFEVLRKSLGVDVLTSSQLAYFARVARAVTYETGFAAFLCKSGNGNAAVGGNDQLSEFISCFVEKMASGEVD